MREMLCISRPEFAMQTRAFQGCAIASFLRYASELASPALTILATFKKKYFVQKQKKSPLSQGGHCREPESNWHVNCLTQDFKSWASTNSAIPASEFNYITLKRYFQVPNNNI